MIAYRPYGNIQSKERQFTTVPKRNYSSLRLLLFTVIVSLCCSTAMILSNNNVIKAQEETEHHLIYVVGSGDTLWNIAQQFVDQSDDVRNYIYRLMKVNELKSSAIRPGQQLIIPES